MVLMNEEAEDDLSLNGMGLLLPVLLLLGAEEADEVSLKHAVSQAASGITWPQRGQPMTHVDEPDANEVPELADPEVLALGGETSATPRSAQKRAKRSASMVRVRKAKRDGAIRF
ncbi:hypothetical protein LWI29_011507 [Acer saccharum]|uniref:Uncharacterized protein n=1 Tax=Acer saccharum TaxID=4024 RepID=A0AA39W2M7_ACESA|nr:hypothetical protein LWI29_011507 [Acer saccharum]